MLLCAKYATILCDNVFISIPKTGKFIITLRKITEVAAHINKQNGTRSNRQITDVNSLVGNGDVSLNTTDYLQESFLSILAGIHCFTGFDTLSAFPEKICMDFPKKYDFYVICAKKTSMLILSNLSAVADLTMTQLTRLDFHKYGKGSDGKPPDKNQIHYIICYQKVTRSGARLLNHVAI